MDHIRQQSPARRAKTIARAIVDGKRLPCHYDMHLEHQAWIEGMIVRPSLARVVDRTSEREVAMHMAKECAIEGLHPMPPDDYVEKMEREAFKYSQGRNFDYDPDGGNSGEVDEDEDSPSAMRFC